MTDEATAPEHGTTGETTNEEVVDSVNEEATNEETSTATEEPHTLLGGEDPMLKIPDKFLNEEGEPDYEKLTKSYNNLEKMKGPISNAPESADGYEIPEDLMNNDYVDFSEDSMVELRTKAHELGISNDQMNFFLEQHAETMSQFVPTPIQLETELKEAWGEDNFASNINAASQVLDSLGADIPEDEIIGNLPLIKLAAIVSREMNQDTPDIKPNVESVGTEERLNELMASPDYWVTDSETRIEADKILNRLYA